MSPPGSVDESNVCSLPRVDVLADGVKRPYVAAMLALVELIAGLLGLDSWIADRLSPRGRRIVETGVLWICVLATIVFSSP